MAESSFVASRTEGMDSLKESLKGFTLNEAAEKTGVLAGDIVRAARAFAKSSASAILYSMGITQHVCGTDNVMACATLALICGQIGRHGAGVWPMRGYG